MIADNSCDPVFVASDLLSQAEHGTDSQVVLLTVKISNDKFHEIQAEIKKQASTLPRRDIVAQSLSKSFAIRFETIAEALQFSNDHAPEHLILHINESNEALKNVSNAGSVFLGPYSSERQVCGFHRV